MKAVTELEEWDEEEFVPEMTEFRAAVDRIKNRRDSILIKALYLLALRVNEITTKVSPSVLKRGTEPLGQYIDCSIGHYRILDSNTYSYRDERAAVFRCAVLKRKPKSKKRKHVYKVVALPCDPKYEPWTVHLLRWFKEKNGLGFPITEMQVRRIVKKHLAILDPKVHPHSLRHWRATHLASYYDFDSWELCAYMGWSHKSMFTKIAMPVGKTDIYVHIAWKRYFPKLLRPLQT